MQFITSIHKINGAFATKEGLNATGVEFGKAIIYGIT